MVHHACLKLVKGSTTRYVSDTLYVWIHESRSAKFEL